jgi:hypothetical protein
VVQRPRQSLAQHGGRAFQHRQADDFHAVSRHKGGRFTKGESHAIRAIHQVAHQAANMDHLSAGSHAAIDDGIGIKLPQFRDVLGGDQEEIVRRGFIHGDLER